MGTLLLRRVPEPASLRHIRDYLSYKIYSSSNVALRPSLALDIDSLSSRNRHSTKMHHSDKAQATDLDIPKVVSDFTGRGRLPFGLDKAVVSDPVRQEPPATLACKSRSPGQRDAMQSILGVCRSFRSVIQF